MNTKKITAQKLKRKRGNYSGFVFISFEFKDCRDTKQYANVLSLKLKSKSCRSMHPSLIKTIKYSTEKKRKQAQR